MKHLTKARTATIGVVTASALLTVGGIAYAVWTSSGTGAGTAKASAFNTPTVAINTAGTPTNALYPGATTDLLVLASNNNPFPVTITLSQDAANKVTSDKAGCNETTNGSAAITGVTFAGGSITVPANQTSTIARTVANAVSMSSASSSNCIGATFSIPLVTSSSPS